MTGGRRRGSFPPQAGDGTHVDKLTSIMAVIDPGDDDTRNVIAKVVVLARHFRARLELFLCDSERAFTLRHAYDSTGVAEARRKCVVGGMQYLDALKRSVAEDVEISTHVVCDSPLYEVVVRRVLETRPDLVVKSASGHHPLRRFTLDANDWQLARTCPAPLMLTRGRPWTASPRFAAAVDVSDPQGGGLARSILQTAGFLTQGCHAQLDVVYSDRDADLPAEHARRVDALGRLVNEFRVGGEHIHVLSGDADDTLPEFAAGRDFDLMVLGALTRREGLSRLVGTLTGRLVDALTCDFVLVKSDSYACPFEQPTLAATA